MNRKEFGLLIENWRNLFRESKNIRVYMCHDPDWRGADFVEEFHKKSVGEDNIFGLVEQIVGVERLLPFESEKKLDIVESREKVDDIKKSIRRGDSLPPILVRVVREGESFEIVDGHHRYWGYKELFEEEGIRIGVKIRIIPKDIIEDVYKKDDLPSYLI